MKDQDFFGITQTKENGSKIIEELPDTNEELKKKCCL